MAFKCVAIVLPQLFRPIKGNSNEIALTWETLCIEYATTQTDTFCVGFCDEKRSEHMATDSMKG
jgi:hypothetical protein